MTAGDDDDDETRLRCAYARRGGERRKGDERAICISA